MHRNALPLDAKPILLALREYGAVGVIVGSYGAIAQGVELEMTDIDISPKLSSENIRAIARALASIGAREAEVDADNASGGSLILDTLIRDPEFIHTRDLWMFLTPHGEVDLVMHPAGFPNGYADLVDEEAELGQEGESGILYASLDDIRRSKEEAGRHKDVEALNKFPPPTKSNVKFPPLPDYDESLLLARSHKKSESLILRETTDRNGKTIHRWMRP